MKIKNVDFTFLSGHLYGHLSPMDYKRVESFIDKQSDLDKLSIIELAVYDPKVYQEFTHRLLCSKH